MHASMHPLTFPLHIAAQRGQCALGLWYFQKVLQHVQTLLRQHKERQSRRAPSPSVGVKPWLPRSAFSTSRKPLTYAISATHSGRICRAPNQNIDAHKQALRTHCTAGEAVITCFATSCGNMLWLNSNNSKSSSDSALRTTPMVTLAHTELHGVSSSCGGVGCHVSWNSKATSQMCARPAWRPGEPSDRRYLTVPSSKLTGIFVPGFLRPYGQNLTGNSQPLRNSTVDSVHHT